jgi:hypothetical protein
MTFQTIRLLQIPGLFSLIKHFSSKRAEERRSATLLLPPEKETADCLCLAHCTEAAVYREAALTPGPAVLRLKSVYRDLCCAHDGGIDVVLPARFFSGRNPGGFPSRR